LPEKFQLYPNMTGTENLHFFSQVTGHALNEDRALVGRNGAGNPPDPQPPGPAAVRQGRRHPARHPRRSSTPGRKHVAYLPEKFQLYPNMTGTENLHFFSQVTGHALNEDRA
ncbi:hypothetical protein CTI14_55775, partial [Methylobacterium radiotolerans]